MKIIHYSYNFGNKYFVYSMLYDIPHAALGIFKK